MHVSVPVHAELKLGRECRSLSICGPSQHAQQAIMLALNHFLVWSSAHASYRTIHAEVCMCKSAYSCILTVKQALQSICATCELSLTVLPSMATNALHASCTLRRLHKPAHVTQTMSTRCAWLCHAQPRERPVAWTSYAGVKLRPATNSGSSICKGTRQH